MNTPIAKTQADLQALVASLFARFPALVGFSVAEAAPDKAGSDDLCLSHVVTFPGHVPSAELVDEIAAPLVELLEDEPDARELLRGRTFARSLH